MILRNTKSLIRRYPVAVVLNFTGLVAALLAFALIFLQADYDHMVFAYKICIYPNFL